MATTEYYGTGRRKSAVARVFMKRGSGGIVVNGKPIRASKESIEWCLRAVDQCYQMKLPRIRLEEQAEMKAHYESARQAYRERLQEVDR